MNSMKLTSIIKEKDKSEIDKLLIREILNIVESEPSLEVLLRYRSEALESISNDKYSIKDIRIDELRKMPEYITSPILYERDDYTETIIYKTEREGVYVEAINDLLSFSKRMRLINMDIRKKNGDAE